MVCLDSNVYFALACYWAAVTTGEGDLNSCFSPDLMPLSLAQSTQLSFSLDPASSRMSAFVKVQLPLYCMIDRQLASVKKQSGAHFQGGFFGILPLCMLCCLQNQAVLSGVDKLVFARRVFNKVCWRHLQILHSYLDF